MKKKIHINLQIQIIVQGENPTHKGIYFQVRILNQCINYLNKNQ